MSRRLNVIVGCEESGVVRAEFRALGHNAWSCDLAPARDGSPYHLQHDIRAVIRKGGPAPGSDRHWDLGIFHPPCTYLCNSGVRWFTTIPRIQKPGTAYGNARDVAMQDGADLFAALYHAEIPKVAIENPVMHRYAREALRRRGVPAFDQSVQPWQFGDPEFKRTCLWLRGLAPLVIDPADALIPPKRGEPGHKEWSAVHRASPGPHRARDRSVTFAGLARVMAWQWGGDAREERD